MTTYRSLNHTKWHCQYHVVFIPKYRKKAMYGGLRQELGDVFRRLAVHRESEVEGRASAGGPRPYDDVDSAEILGGAGDRVSQREECDPHRSGVCGPLAQLRGAALLGPGYFVSTVGRDERVIREYIQQQEREDRRLDQLPLD